MSFIQCNCKSTYHATGEYIRYNKQKKITEHFDTNIIETGDLSASGPNQSISISQQPNQASTISIGTVIDCNSNVNYPDWHPCVDIQPNHQVPITCTSNATYPSGHPCGTIIGKLYP
jgi:hypothetical protein